MGKKGKTTTCAPIIDKGSINRILKYPGKEGFFCKLMMYAGMRVSEAQRIRWGDLLAVRYPHTTVRDILVFEVPKQSKKQKRLIVRRVPLHEPFKSDIRKFWEKEGYPKLEEYIFKPERGSKYPHIQYHQAQRYVQKVLQSVGAVTRSFGTHTLRKTMARMYHDNAAASGHDNPLLLTAQMLGHKNVSTTVTYLGFTEDDVAEHFSEDFYGIKRNPVKPMDKLSLKAALDKVKEELPHGPKALWVDALMAYFPDVPSVPRRTLLELWIHDV